MYAAVKYLLLSELEQRDDQIAEPLAAGDSGLRAAFISEPAARSARAGSLA